MEPATKTRPVVRIGVAGLPPEFEATYSAALSAVGGRVRMTAVWDPTPGRAAEIAAAERCTPCYGLVELARRPDVDALIVLDTGWIGHRLLPLLAAQGKSVFLGLEVTDVDTLAYLHTIATLNRSLWIPRLTHRFSPSTTRLMELLATRLGPVSAIEHVVPAGRQMWTVPALASIVDWAFFTLRSALGVHSMRIDQDGCRVRFQLTGGERRFADLTIYRAREAESPATRVHARDGEAILTGETGISWRQGRTSAFLEESLTGDNSGIATQLAVFLRRAAGGLIPTADLADLHRSVVVASQLATACMPDHEPRA